MPEFFPENAANLIPNISVTGLLSLEALQPRPREYLNHTFSSALTLQHGTHTVKTGGLIALEHVTSNSLARTTQGSFTFGPEAGSRRFKTFSAGNSGGACGDACTIF